MPKSIYDTLRQAHDQSLARQQAADRARDRRFAQDQGATIDETMANAHDRLHPEQAPPEQHWRAVGLPPVDSASATAIAGGSGDDLVVGDAGDDTLLEPYAPKYADRFYEDIAERESRGGGYGARNDTSDGKPRPEAEWAWGRYGITASNLKALGLMNADGTWTGVLGIKDDKDFLSNKNQAQERVLDAYLEDIERLNQRNLQSVGRVNGRRILDEGGVRPPLAITEAGLMAAAHRAGPGWVGEYLKWLQANGWQSNLENLPNEVPFRKTNGDLYTKEEIDTWLRRVETRIREFERTPYRR